MKTYLRELILGESITEDFVQFALKNQERFTKSGCHFILMLDKSFDIIFGNQKEYEAKLFDPVESAIQDKNGVILFFVVLLPSQKIYETEFVFQNRDNLGNIREEFIVEYENHL